MWDYTCNFQSVSYMCLSLFYIFFILKAIVIIIIILDDEGSGQSGIVSCISMNPLCATDFAVGTYSGSGGLSVHVYATHFNVYEILLCC